MTEDIRALKIIQDSMEKECISAFREMNAFKKEISKKFEDFAEATEIKLLLDKVKADDVNTIRNNIEENLLHFHEIYISKAGKELVDSIIKLVTLSTNANYSLYLLSSTQSLNILKFGGTEIWAETWSIFKSTSSNENFVDYFLNSVTAVEDTISQNYKKSLDSI